MHQFFHVFLTPSIKLRYITIKSIENSPSQLIFGRLIALQHFLVITQLLYCIDKLLIHISFEELLIDADIMIGMHLAELWQSDECCWIDVFDFVVLCSDIKEEKWMNNRISKIKMLIEVKRRFAYVNEDVRASRGWRKCQLESPGFDCAKDTALAVCWDPGSSLGRLPWGRWLSLRRHARLGRLYSESLEYGRFCSFSSRSLRLSRWAPNQFYIDAAVLAWRCQWDTRERCQRRRSKNRSRVDREQQAAQVLQLRQQMQQQNSPRSAKLTSTSLVGSFKTLNKSFLWSRTIFVCWK